MLSSHVAMLPSPLEIREYVRLTLKHALWLTIFFFEISFKSSSFGRRLVD